MITKVHFGKGLTNINSVRYTSISSRQDGIDSTSDDENWAYFVIPEPTKFAYFKVQLDSAPGVGKSITFTIRVNSIDTLLAITISGTNTTGSDLSDIISTNTGDLISISITPFNNPTLDVFRWSILSNSQNDILLGSQGNQVAIGLKGASPPSGNEHVQALEGINRVYKQAQSPNDPKSNVVIPVAGTLKNLYVRIDEPLTGNDEVHFEIWVNGVATALATSVSGANTTNFNISTNLSLNAGDLVFMMVFGKNLLLVSIYYSWGMSFVPSVNNGSFLMTGCQVLEPANNGRLLLPPLGVESTGGTDLDTQILSNGVNFSNLWYKLIGTTGQPGAGVSTTLALRNNAVTTALSVTISDTDTYGFDIVNTVQTIANDLVNLIFSRTAAMAGVSRLTFSLTGLYTGANPWSFNAGQLMWFDAPSCGGNTEQFCKPNS